MKSVRHAAQAGAVIVASSLAVPPVLASEAAPPATDMVTEVIVTATRRAERLQDVPIAISAIGADTLEKLSATSSSYNDFVKGLSSELREEQKLGSLGLLNARLWTDYGDWQFALFGQNLLNDIETAGYAEAVSVAVPGRPRYSINRPRSFGVSVSRNF